MSNSAKAGFRIGRWDVDPQQNLLKSPEHTKTLEPKVMDVLVFLAEKQGEVVSRQEILDAVWGEVVVGDEVVSRAVSLLRTELGDDQSNPRYLKTISKRGYSLIADVILTSSDESIPHRATRKLLFAIIAILTLVVAFFAIDRKEPERSVAVLPFADMSPKGDQEYFGDGMAVALLNELVRLDGLRVSPRTSSFSFKGTDESLSAIAEALNVTTIVEGSIRKGGDQVSITAQLIRIADGEILWSDTYDRKLENIFAIQEEIATAVSGALGVKLGVGGVNDYRGAGTQSFEAYEEFGKAQTSGPGEEGIRHLKRAIELDPNYAAAWSWLAANIVLRGWGKYPGENRANEEEAYALVRRAVELDPESAHSNTILGLMLQIRRDWILADEAHLKALSLSSDSPALNQYGSMLQRVGRFAAALEFFDKSEALTTKESYLPMRVRGALAEGRIGDARVGLARRPTWLGNKGVDVSIALHEGDTEEIKAIMAAQPPTDIATLELYAPVLEVFDSRESVLSTLRAVYADNDSRWPSKLHDIAFLAAYFGDSQLALQTFAEELSKSSIRLYAVWYPLMAEVRQSQGFKELMTDLSLVAYWRAVGWPDQCRPLGAEDFECF
ncbi:MAG: winged helix-turn-helix domain-containing protein [Woeseiaceae bacterium]